MSGLFAVGGGKGSRVSEIVSAARAGGHEIESFCVEVTVPPVIAVREHAMWCDADALSDTNHCYVVLSRLHACMCIDIYIYVYVCIDKSLQVYSHACIYVCLYMNACACACI